MQTLKKYDDEIAFFKQNIAEFHEKLSTLQKNRNKLNRLLNGKLIIAIKNALPSIDANICIVISGYNDYDFCETCGCFYYISLPCFHCATLTKSTIEYVFNKPFPKNAFVKENEYVFFHSKHVMQKLITDNQDYEDFVLLQLLLKSHYIFDVKVDQNLRHGYRITTQYSRWNFYGTIYLPEKITL